MNRREEILRTSEPDRRLLLKLQHRLLMTPAVESEPEPSEVRRLEAALAIAPMALAFLYLMVLTVILFR